jgi:uncharacterized protein YdhG (YjbR/CyaY superfamily)
MKKPASINEYIKGFPPETQKLLEEIRSTIRKAAPDAQEKISYAMPSFSQNGILVYFAAFKNHIGFYPTSSAVELFEKDLSVYKRGRGSVQFPLDKPLPKTLIAEIVKFRVQENLGKKKKNK